MIATWTTWVNEAAARVNYVLVNLNLLNMQVETPSAVGF